jgi:hypothetical protein
MYDTLSQLFVLCFAGFYLVFFAVFLFTIVKPWLVQALKKYSAPILQRVGERARLLQGRSGTEGEGKLRIPDHQCFSPSDRRLPFHALPSPPLFSRLPELPEPRQHQTKC